MDQTASEGQTRLSEVVETSGEDGASPNRMHPTMDASDKSNPRGQSVDGCTEYERVGRYLLVEEIAERRETIDDVLDSLEHSATEQRPIQGVQVRTLLDELEELEELAQKLQLAGTDEAQEVTV